MRPSILLILFFISIGLLSAQKKVTNKINQMVNATEVEAHLSFLAADEMRGRNTGSAEIDIAANYIAAQFKISGAKPAGGTTSYFQDVQLEKIIPPTEATLTIGSDLFRLKDDLLLYSGGSTLQEKDIIFIGYGTKDDFEKNDVKDKIVIAYAGSQDTKNSVRALLADSNQKNKVAAAQGAAALIEIVTLPGVPWQSLVNFLSADRMFTKIDQENTFPHLLMKNSEAAAIRSLLETKKTNGKLSVNVLHSQPVKAKNVIGIIEGTDDILKNEWIAITAHYDHIGVKKNPTPDSIFNGARDNAIGTVALLQTAKFFGMDPPKRSVVLIGFTGEEKGLLGSQWYSNHPVIPLNQTVFDINCDGGGYNDKSIATIIDFNRTTADELLKKACLTYGLVLNGDPAPEQGLYERSDNLNFAVKGIPSVNISPGVKAFDQEVLKYYHQPSDEVGSLDMQYLEKFYRSFVFAAYLVANTAEAPTWKKGDKFEATGKNLYSK